MIVGREFASTVSSFVISHSLVSCISDQFLTGCAKVVVESEVTMDNSSNMMSMVESR